MDGRTVMQLRADIDKFNETMSQISEMADREALRMAFGNGWCRGFLLGSCAGMLWAIFVMVFC